MNRRVPGYIEQYGGCEPTACCDEITAFDITISGVVDGTCLSCDTEFNTTHNITVTSSSGGVCVGSVQLQPCGFGNTIYKIEWSYTESTRVLFVRVTDISETSNYMTLTKTVSESVDCCDISESGIHTTAAGPSCDFTSATFSSITAVCS